MVARHEQRTVKIVPDGKCKDTVEAFDTCSAPLFVSVEDDLCIASRLEGVPGFEQLFSQLDVVINLSIEDDLEGPIFVRDGLTAPCNVDDAESPVSQTDLVRYVS